jgi:hypothetical protein
MGRHLFAAIHVEGEGNVALGGQLLGAALGVVVEAPPLVHHQHAGARPLGGVVPGQQAGEHRLAVRVLDRLGLDLGRGERCTRKPKCKR